MWKTKYLLWRFRFFKWNIFLFFFLFGTYWYNKINTIAPPFKSYRKNLFCVTCNAGHAHLSFFLILLQFVVYFSKCAREQHGFLLFFFIFFVTFWLPFCGQSVTLEPPFADFWYFVPFLNLGQIDFSYHISWH